MKINIIEEKQNPVLKRKELIAELEYDGPTSSKAELQKKLSEMLNTDIKKIEIKKILSHVGKAGGRAWTNIWEEKEAPKEKPPEPKAEKKKAEPEKKKSDEAKE